MSFIKDLVAGKASYSGGKVTRKRGSKSRNQVEDKEPKKLGRKRFPKNKYSGREKQINKIKELLEYNKKLDKLDSLIGKLSIGDKEVAKEVEDVKKSIFNRPSKLLNPPAM